MSNELQSLLARIEASDPSTAKELRRHIDALQERRRFGLNFEHHTPESVGLTGRPIAVGDKVRFLPPRGEKEAESGLEFVAPRVDTVAHHVTPAPQRKSAVSVAHLARDER